MSRQDFIDSSLRFSSWCQEALKYWAKQAVDPRGGFAEYLGMDGTPDFDHLRRVRVQARQAYVYAHAAHLGWYDGAKTASDQAWNFAIGPGSEGGAFIKSGPKGCAHLVKGNGDIHDDMRDTYAQAFIVLAGAWRFRAFGEPASLVHADGVLDYLNTHVKAENGGWLEALPAPKNDQRRQNPHMHLFEAFLALYEATQDDKYLNLAHDIFVLFKDYFFDPERNAVLEYFTPDWRVKGNGGPIEPGHMMEWCWLLRQYERLSGRGVDRYADRLYQGALEAGLNEKLGLICDSVALDEPSIEPTFRTWPQTELIKASVAQAAAGHQDMYKAAAQAIEALFNYYLDVPVYGGWADKLSNDGTILSNVMPTSTFYHLFCAASEAEALAASL